MMDHKVSALFSTVDEELPLVAQNRDLLGCRVLLSDQKPIETCLDKLTCMHTLSEACIPAADTLEVTNRSDDDLHQAWRAFHNKTENRQGLPWCAYYPWQQGIRVDLQAAPF